MWDGLVWGGELVDVRHCGMRELWGGGMYVWGERCGSTLLHMDGNIISQDPVEI